MYGDKYVEEEKLTYINILISILKKKEDLLKKLKAETDKQADLIAESEFDPDAFDATISKKQEYIDSLLQLDDGFMDIYSKVKETMKNNSSDYRPEIEEAKKLIKRQTELSVELQSLESKNQTGLAIHLSRGKQKVREFKTSSKTAAAYYKSMTNHHQDGDSYFLDRKK